MVNLIAGRNHDVGDVRVWNDGVNLYVQYQTIPGWLLTSAKVHVGLQLSDIPQTRSGNPIPGHFDFQTDLNPGVGTHTEIIPLSEFGGAGVQLYIAAYASVRHTSTLGYFNFQEGAWGQGTRFPGRNWAMYFNYVIQECDSNPGVNVSCLPINPGDFTTHTQEQWAGPVDGQNAAWFLQTWFQLCFVNGLRVGSPSGFQITFTDLAALKAFLPQVGPPHALTSNHVNPPTSEGGALAGELVALTLNVTFDRCVAVFCGSDIPLDCLRINDPCSPCNGMTVREVLLLGNAILGGTSTAMTPEEITECIRRINANFSDGVVGGFLCWSPVSMDGAGGKR